MRSIKVLHSADFHMDSPFDALSDSKAAVRRAELRQLPKKIAKLAISEKADLILLCGDLLDSDNVFKETGEELLDSFRVTQIPIFIAPGNHDYYHSKTVYASRDLPENVFIFKKNAIEYYDFPEKGFRVYGAGFTDRSAPSLLNGFCVKHEEEIAKVMCLHGDVGVPDSPYNPISTEQIRESGLDYLALGHIHKASGLQKEGSTFYSYSGCAEGRGFDETGEKTVNIISIEDGKCTLRPVSLAARKYEKIEVDISDKDPLFSIQLNLPDETIRDIYRIIIKGTAEKTLNVSELYSQLSGLFFELRLEDKTTLKREIWETAGENTLRGTFLSKMKSRFDAAESDQEKEIIEMAVRWGISALDNCEEIVVHEDQ